MSIRTLATRLSLALACLSLLGAGVVVAYGPPAPYIVKVSGPSRAADCGDTVTLTATVLNSENRKPVREQFVNWAVDKGSSLDRLAASRTRTNNRGRTSVQFTIGKALGDRRVTGTASNIKGRTTIKVDCVLPTPTPRPTPTPTRRPTATPRPTVKPTQRPGRTPKPTPTAAPTIVLPVIETTELTVGYREADLPGQAPFLLATDQGLWQERGLTNVALVLDADPLDEVLDGSLDVAVMPLDEALQAIAEGEPIAILAGYHQYQSDLVAVAAGIADLAGLDGRSVVIGDDVRSQLRVAALADLGWDLTGAGAVETLPDGGFDGWADALLAGDVSLAPILNRHRFPLSEANGSVILDRRVFGDDVLVTSDATLADMPLTLTAFLAGSIEALQQLTDPATDEVLFGLFEATGTVPSQGIRAGWPLDLDDLRPWDGSLGEPSVGAGLGELDAHAAELLGWVPLPIDHIALDILAAAQAAAGVPSTTVLPVLDAPSVDILRIGAPADAGARAPLLLADAADAFTQAGFTDAELVDDGIAGVVDGFLTLAVATATEAAEAIGRGDPIVIVGGYQPTAAEPTVLVARTDLPDATTAAALQAVLRGLADLNRADGLERLLTQDPGADAAALTAAWPELVAGFAPFDLSTGDPADPIPTALAAARASVGLMTQDGA